MQPGRELQATPPTWLQRLAFALSTAVACGPLPGATSDTGDTAAASSSGDPGSPLPTGGEATTTTASTGASESSTAFESSTGDPPVCHARLAVIQICAPFFSAPTHNLVHEIIHSVEVGFTLAEGAGRYVHSDGWNTLSSDPTTQMADAYASFAVVEEKA